MSSNGKLDKTELRRIYHPSVENYLQKDAAASWNTMRMACKRYLRIDLYSSGPRSAYRKYADQVYFWNLYQSGQGNLAAYPGSSNHGLGLAIDLATMPMRAAINRIGKKYGWAKEWSDAQSEWWHLKYRSGVWKGPNPGTDYKNPIARRGSGVHGQKWFVKNLQRLLRKHIPTAKNKLKVDGDFGARTDYYVRKFQRLNGLPDDGVVGPKTWKALRAKPRKITARKPARKPAPKPTPVKPKPPVKKPTVKVSTKPTKTSHRGLDLIKEFEGFYSRPYNDPVGHATIGYGTLLHYGNVTEADRKKWGTITKERATELLKEELVRFEKDINDNVKVRLNQNQFDALASFIYNVGGGAFKSSTLLRKLNAGDFSGAANEFLRWDKASGQTLPGLTRRRRLEKELFERKF